MSTSTTTTGHVNSALPLSNPSKLTDQSARKIADTELTDLSLFSAGAFNLSSLDPLPAGASFLLELHRRREKSDYPSQKMKRKEREYLEMYAHPSFNMTSMDLGSSTQSAAPRQSMTRKERNSLLGEALDLISDE